MFSSAIYSAGRVSRRCFVLLGLCSIGTKLITTRHSDTYHKIKGVIVSNWENLNFLFLTDFLLILKMAENSPMGNKGMLCIIFWVFKASLFWLDSDLESDSETYVILERFPKMYFLKNKTFCSLIFPGLTPSQCFSNSVNSKNGSDWM